MIYYIYFKWSLSILISQEGKHMKIKLQLVDNFNHPKLGNYYCNSRIPRDKISSDKPFGSLVNTSVEIHHVQYRYYIYSHDGFCLF